MTDTLIAKLESASEGSVWTDAEANELIDALGRDRCGGAPAGIALAYVALNGSIDAALALAERCGLRPYMADATIKGRWRWMLENPALLGDLEAEPWVNGTASTPALAICAALLRASAAEGAGQ